MQRLWPNQSIFSWLQKILAERYGHVFSIQSVDVDTLCLNYQDSPSRILLATNPVSFNRSDSNLPFCTWGGEGRGMGIGSRVLAACAWCRKLTFTTNRAC